MVGSWVKFKPFCYWSPLIGHWELLVCIPASRAVLGLPAQPCSCTWLMRSLPTASALLHFFSFRNHHHPHTQVPDTQRALGVMAHKSKNRVTSGALTMQWMTQTFLGFCCSQLCMFLQTAQRLCRLGACRTGQLHSDTYRNGTMNKSQRHKSIKQDVLVQTLSAKKHTSLLQPRVTCFKPTPSLLMHSSAP